MVCDRIEYLITKGNKEAESDIEMEEVEDDFFHSDEEIETVTSSGNVF